jgi:hypothetical protein
VGEGREAAVVAGLEDAGAEKRERAPRVGEGSGVGRHMGGDLGWAMTWTAERLENGTENKVLYDDT